MNPVAFYRGTQRFVNIDESDGMKSGVVKTATFISESFEILVNNHS